MMKFSYPFLKFYFLVLLTLFCGIFAYSSQLLANDSTSTKTPITVQLHWHHQFEFAGFYAALQQGYYQQQGLEVELKTWEPGISSVQEVAEGRADFAVAYSSSVADFIQGAPIRLAFANFQVSPMVLVSKQPIYNLEQLSGKTVMDHGSVDVLALLNKASDLVDQPIIQVPSTGNIEDFIDGKVDMFSVYQSNEPFTLRERGVPYYLLDPKSFGIQSLGDVVITHQKTIQTKPAMVNAFKAATVKGWQYAFAHPEEVVDFILANFPVKKGRNALMAEAEETPIFVLPEAGEIGDVATAKVKAAAKYSYLAGKVSKSEYQQFQVDEFVYQPLSLNLTTEELRYLKANPKIQIGNDSHWEPFEFVNQQGEFSGMSADYFALMEEKLGVEFVHYEQKPWHEVLVAAKNGEAKVLSCAVATPERKQFMNFTEPYLSFPLVLVASKKINFVDDYELLNGSVVAVPKGYWSEEWLRKNYPEINLLLVDTAKEGLEAVLKGEAKAFSGNLASINFAIKRYGLDGLHIVGEGGARFELAIGVNKSDDVLLSILRKALASITPEQRDEIYKRWIQLELVRKTDHTTLISISGGFILILSLFAWLMWLLQRQKRQQQFYIDQVNELSMATYTNLKTGKIEWASDSFLKLTGCPASEVIGKSHFNLLHPESDRDQFEALYKKVRDGQIVTTELKAKGCQGQEYWVELTASPETKNGQVVGAWVTRVNITDKKRLEEFAVRDALTGVYNRHQFNELFDSLLHKAKRNHSRFAICMFDIDYFKAINDQFGHQQGDQVLKEVAQATSEFFGRANDLIFRIGGEEFVIMSDFTSPAAFKEYLQAFNHHIEALGLQNPASGFQVVTISIGGLYIESVQEDVTDAQIYMRLDELMYQAKSNGRNQLCMDTLESF